MAAKVIHAFRKTTHTFAQGAKTLPQKYFVSPEVFGEEKEKIFAGQWVLVGHQSEVAKTGDYFLRDVSGESVIIARHKSGEIHAFYNVCRHRGTRLCEDARGHAPAIQCPYHAWTYGLDGRLIGAPHMDEIKEFDREEYSLWPVKVGIWEGFIFVNLEPGAESLEEWFAPLAGK